MAQTCPRADSLYDMLSMQVHVRVEIPTKLSNDERKIVEELKEIQSTKPVKKKGFSVLGLQPHVQLQHKLLPMCSVQTSIPV